MDWTLIPVLLAMGAAVGFIAGLLGVGGGLTLVPLKMYFNERGVAKVLLGLCRGKQLQDKREDLKKANMKREMDRALRHKR